MSTRQSVVTGAFSVIWAISIAAGAEILPIGVLGLGVSGDGATVAGASEASNQLQAHRWNAGSLQLLGSGTGLEVSRDGTAVVGERFNGVTVRSFRWTAAQGMVDLGQLPGAGASGSATSNAFDVSADGSVVVGQARGATAFRGFRWTQASGMQALGDLPGGIDFSVANSISADGQVLVGASNNAIDSRAVRWIGSNTTPIDMGVPAGLGGFTEAKGVSGNGQVIVGVWGDGLQNEAFRWTQIGGYELIGDLPGGLRDSVATATNMDGSVIVGTGNSSAELPDEAIYWTRENGVRSLWSILHDAGTDLSGWQSLQAAADVSDDGNVVVGNGVLADGTFAGFRAVIPEPTTAGAVIVGGLLACASTRRRPATLSSALDADHPLKCRRSLARSSLTRHQIPATHPGHGSCADD